MLVVGRVTRGGRAPVFMDPIEASLVVGTWSRPEAGAMVAGPNGKMSWQRIEPNENGVFQHDALRGGYGLAVVESESDRVALLDARGHRHVYVNGVPRGGDVYDLGWTRLPIVLRRGENELLFKGGRGRIRARITTPPADIFVESKDPTLPDVIRGEASDLPLGVTVTNATSEWREFVTRVSLGGSAPLEQSWRLAPLSSRKLPLVARPGATMAPLADDPDKTSIKVSVGNHHRQFTVRLRGPRQKHRRTFVSDIDGSVQYYGVTPAQSVEGDPAPAMFLSLHGAGVEGMRQAGSYRARNGGVIVAPTNRRPFGFDWEDWGRLDALEVLALAERRFGSDPARTYLTGHSMGGHGTWSIGGLYPDRFAAIAPSAGWRDFESYGGHPSWTDDPTPVQGLLDRAQNASRTLLFEENYLHGGVYILHGDRDDNVPVEQARFMRRRLAGFHPNWAYYERPGAGHWWGNQCMDWPPLFEFLGHNRRPSDREMLKFAFTTLHPAMSDRCYWVTIVAQNEWMAPSRVAVDLQSDKLTVTTNNVEQVAFDLSAFVSSDGAADPFLQPGSLSVEIDGRALTVDLTDQRIELQRRDHDWHAIQRRRLDRKGPHRAGPFKEAFRHRMVFVVPTGGTDEENAAWYAKARYDAETFQYRGNGSIEIVRDSTVPGYVGRNLILYGNRSINRAWSEVEGDEIDVTGKSIRVGGRIMSGNDLALVAVRPRKETTDRSVGIIASTGMPGARLTHQLGYWISGAGFPDWIVYGWEMLDQGSLGVRGAGYFDRDWRAASGGHAWRD